MTDRPPVWSDEAILDVLHRMEHLGQSASEVARAYGTTRNAILGLRHRVLGPQDSRRPTAGDGTMPPDWWRR
ncbi:hypothetical protein [Rubellimicrobium sp. CFH 75288]|uniref:hypothetical protein n=1 Tax=Rubellimicrobium sp. CFH 75288 TaxID=2697034 RepID=UPI0014132BBD|nr:hypothetical protein [Rubellimicrobium sp. CFH 75288]NAZ37171.1 hypothetical protein [Rubellimicrobium sp. CFH 75288]